MKKKINSKFMLISAIAIIVMAICAMVLFYDILKKQIFDDLKANAHVISMMKPEDLPDEINYNLNKDGLRITLINEDGTVIYDSMEDESKMENHRERPEIVSALAAGEGRAMRKSTTSTKHTFYYAMRTDDGKVLRIGKDSNSIYSLIIKMVYLTLSVGFCVFVLCTVLAHRLTKRLVAPIEKMADNIVLLEENDVYDEHQAAACEHLKTFPDASGIYRKCFPRIKDAAHRDFRLCRTDCKWNDKRGGYHSFCYGNP